MKLDFSNYTLNRAVEVEGDVDVAFELVYTKGSYSKPWAEFGFTHYEGRSDVWEYHGDSLVGDPDANASGRTRYDVFLNIIGETECLAIVATSNDEEEDVYCTESGYYPVSDFDSAADLVRYLYLAEDFKSESAAQEYFGYDDDSFPVLSAQVEAMEAARYYQRREKYERHFAEMSDDPIRERLADDFARKKQTCKDVVLWAEKKRNGVGI